MAKRVAAIMAATTLLAVLAGCGDAPERNKAAAPVVTVNNPYHDRLAALGDLQQGAALRTAIRSAGESCNRVAARAFQQDYTNLKMWTAQCQNTNYAIFLAPNGDVQVRDCAQAAALKLPACRIPAAAGTG